MIFIVRFKNDNLIFHCTFYFRSRDQQTSDILLIVNGLKIPDKDCGLGSKMHTVLRKWETCSPLRQFKVRH